MPGYAPLAPIPFAGRRDSRVTDILMQRGQQQAEAARAGGDIWGRAIQGVGNAVSRGIDSYQQNLAMKSKAEFEANKAQREAQKEEREFGMQDRRLQLDEESARRDADKDREALRATKLAFEDQKNDYLASLADKVEPYLSGPDGGVGAFQEGLKHASEFLDDSTMEELGQVTPDKIPQVFQSIRQSSPKWKAAQAAKAEADAKAANEGRDDARADMTLAEQVRHNKSTEAQARVGGDGKAMWVTRGKDVLHIPESQIQPGDTPYESARTAVKKIPAGSAEKLGAYQSGLASVDDIEKTLSGNNATGPLAYAESKIPNAVTAVTGWGTDAKAKQANIALVKQIIGKTLEGGVLRKEDEEKYKDILPLIGDGEDVVKAKLVGLRRAIRNKNTADVDALEDAGYDMAQFRAREEAKTPPAATVRKKFNPATGRVE